MSLIDKTSDPCRVGLFPLGIGQHTLDACGVGGFGRIDSEAPRRGGMSVEPIKDLRPTPRRGGMYVVNEPKFFPSPCRGEMNLPDTYDLCEVGFLIRDFRQHTLDASDVRTSLCN
ncbi:hypothetical protein KKA87_04640 [bacterium]|nr:hypothetical protein [bacterium]